jgi:hypothetical protein
MTCSFYRDVKWINRYLFPFQFEHFILINFVANHLVSTCLLDSDSIEIIV